MLNLEKMIKENDLQIYVIFAEHTIGGIDKHFPRHIVKLTLFYCI